MAKLKLISVTDTQFPMSLLESISEQRHNGLFCDVTIIVQDRKFRAHKTMLSASSTYFRQLFSVAGQVIELNFIKSDIFEIILNYIYSSKLVRIRSDKLDDLISAGQILGVKFIANLATPLSQVRGLPGLSKEGESGNIGSTEKNESGTENMPIITESFSLSAEEFGMTGSSAGKDDTDSDDVLFVSQVEAPKAQKTKPPHSTDAEEEPEAKKQKVSSEEWVNVDQSKKSKELSSKGVAEVGTVQNHLQPKREPTPLASPPMMSPESSSSVPTSPARSSSHSAPSTPAHVNSFMAKAHNSSLSPEANEVFGVQKKKVLMELSPDQPGKIKLSDVRPAFSTNNGPGMDATPNVSTKKTITLDKASEIDSLSPGCKVYANIGENTYDIVPVREDAGEGDSRAGPGRKPQTSPNSTSSVSSSTAKGKKKAKTEQEDHYELIMDGKTFYVCAVCKRPYVCLTSLRRHFNTHSWERKYPCRYCDKVFALAEYRTKHEITHTGERRYQCLVCNEMFLNYQLLSSHCKQAHNQDPSGRKQKDDTDNNLYRLLPCKTLQFKPYSFVSEEAGGIPVINEDGLVQHINPGKAHFMNQGVPPGESKMLNWDDVFVEPEAHTRPGAHARPGPPPRPGGQMNVENATTEFEFVIPETY
ncbi:transcriptional regulator Kaiso [Astyanax mexicanus]|uniref:Zinc finger and BTB domain containing 33 n=1 Tax=Astyanax mexicanus TaxID=7994 RepID=W5LSS2_ASTMX|nr:transcriptional regulator Kaiso [Astyanax mexicanus]